MSPRRRACQPHHGRKKYSAGLGLNNAEDFGATEEFPSDLDLQCTLKYYRDLLSNALPEDRAKYQHMLDLCKKLEKNRRLGRVLVTSGGPASCTTVGLLTTEEARAKPRTRELCVDPNCETKYEAHTQDWALVELKNTEYFMLNRAPTLPETATKLPENQTTFTTRRKMLPRLRR